jgi:hypothetical protein
MSEVSRVADLAGVRAELKRADEHRQALDALFEQNRRHEQLNERFAVEVVTRWMPPSAVGTIRAMRLPQDTPFYPGSWLVGFLILLGGLEYYDGWIAVGAFIGFMLLNAVIVELLVQRRPREG